MKMAVWAMFYKEAMAARRSEAGRELGKVNWERRVWSLGGRTCGIWGEVRCRVWEGAIQGNSVVLGDYGAVERATVCV